MVFLLQIIKWQDCIIRIDKIVGLDFGSQSRDYSRAFYKSFFIKRGSQKNKRLIGQLFIWLVKRTRQVLETQGMC
jgi:hypothetical protein